jgi:hypothetical protein
MTFSFLYQYGDNLNELDELVLFRSDFFHFAG